MIIPITGVSTTKVLNQRSWNESIIVFTKFHTVFRFGKTWLDEFLWLKKKISQWWRYENRKIWRRDRCTLLGIGRVICMYFIIFCKTFAILSLITRIVNDVLQIRSRLKKNSMTVKLFFSSEKRGSRKENFLLSSLRFPFDSCKSRVTSMSGVPCTRKSFIWWDIAWKKDLFRLNLYHFQMICKSIVRLVVLAQTCDLTYFHRILIHVHEAWRDVGRNVWATLQEHFLIGKKKM